MLCNSIIVCSGVTPDVLLLLWHFSGTFSCLQPLFIWWDGNESNIWSKHLCSRLKEKNQSTCIPPNLWIILPEAWSDEEVMWLKGLVKIFCQFFFVFFCSVSLFFVSIECLHFVFFTCVDFTVFVAVFHFSSFLQVFVTLWDQTGSNVPVQRSFSLHIFSKLIFTWYIS